MGIRTPVLSHDGRDLAAALQTILEIGDAQGLHAAVSSAFAGAQLHISTANARFGVSLQMPDFQRPFSALELSDGTLHYLCLLTALMSPRPPRLLAINEPEASIHPDLFEPLAVLIINASRFSQIWITTHSTVLADHIHRLSGVEPILLEKQHGATTVLIEDLPLVARLKQKSAALRRRRDG